MTFQYTDVSLNEYPGEVTLVIYSGGCNYYCPWCFNGDLRKKEPISFKKVKEAVEEHRDFITAVCLTGGEPNVNPQYDKILTYLKSTGLKIKINSNGFIPLHNRGTRTSGQWIDYLHIALKPLDICTCIKQSIPNWRISGDIVEYSFVYSSTFLPKPLLERWAKQINDNILKGHWLDSWTRPDIFTISQLQTGNCLNPQYNHCKVPTRDELVDVALLFSEIPLRKLLIETKEYGRERIF